MKILNDFELTADGLTINYERLGFKRMDDLWYDDGMPSDYWMFWWHLMFQNGKYIVEISNPEYLDYYEFDTRGEADAFIDTEKNHYINITRDELFHNLYEFGRKARQNCFMLLDDFDVRYKYRPCKKEIEIYYAFGDDVAKGDVTLSYEEFLKDVNEKRREV